MSHSEQAKLRPSQEREKELGEVALSSNHQLHQEFGSLEMPYIIYGAHTLQSGLEEFFFPDIKPGNFSLMQLNEIILSIALL